VPYQLIPPPPAARVPEAALLGMGYQKCESREVSFRLGWTKQNHREPRSQSLK
jgi:hypothetical protein